MTMLGAGKFFLKQKWTVPAIARNRPPTGNSQSNTNYKHYACRSQIFPFVPLGVEYDTEV
jgi:hypothetical protein